MRLSIHVPMPTPSRNAFYHKHWRVEWQAKKKWHAMLGALVPGYERFKATTRRRVIILRLGARDLDYDNFVGGLKVVLDSIKQMGLIVDDNPKMLELVCEQRRPAKGEAPNTQIIIEDLP